MTMAAALSPRMRPSQSAGSIGLPPGLSVIKTQSCAQWLDWSYDHQVGDPSLLSELLSGPWRDEDFLVLDPGQSIRMTADDRIIEADDGQDAGAPQT